MAEPISIQCLCGAVHIELSGEPAARANCHCGSCRDFYGTPMLSATAWPASAVRIAKGEAVTFAHPTKQLSRAFCAGCGETLFGTNRLDMRVVPNALVARASGGVLPGNLSPTMHLFYRHRIIDVSDALTKYLEGWDGPELSQ
ncbi:GFA family protein [Rugamonas aquatica]|uniref:Aldehyde-activating protein n=1 Tax=Rugamonas aquatica TaxID=2743357 RepID=A0A6A7N9F2_9BURK|nr:GFA family protein [Rugamonas aquatica]MQA41730.1 aldehyde-activating protein [Rugamonas aquatica]